ncbi:MAG TPA: DUF945 family protein [Patescibacteria group bacterium]|nr:DUF945 family protein [Patescibacteria group bacterium]
MAASVAKAGLIGGAAIAVLGGVWLGTGIVGAREAEARLRPMVDHPLGNGQWRLVNLEHRAGVVTSEGSVDLRLEHALTGTGEGPVVARIDYQISHLPLPTGLVRFHWSVKPAGDSADAVSKVLGPDFKMQGDGRVMASGKVATDMRLPEIALAKDGDSLKMTPLSGSLVVKGSTLTAQWRLARIEQSSQGESVSVEGVAVDVDMTDYKEGVGTSLLAFDKIVTASGAIGGIKLLGQAADHDDRRDIRLAASVATVQAANVTAKDLAFEIAAKGLDRQSLKTLIAVGNSLKPPSTATLEQLDTARSAAAVLLKKGFSLSVPHLGGALASAAGKPQSALLDAHVSLDLAPTTGNGVSLAAQLTSQGAFSLAVSGMLKEQRQMALAQGFITATPDGLAADYALAGGKLTVNGHPYDPAATGALLAAAELQINHFLDPQAFPLAEPGLGDDKTEGEPDVTQVDSAPPPPNR